MCRCIHIYYMCTRRLIDDIIKWYRNNYGKSNIKLIAKVTILLVTFAISLILLLFNLTTIATKELDNQSVFNVFDMTYSSRLKRSVEFFSFFCLIFWLFHPLVLQSVAKTAKKRGKKCGKALVKLTTIIYYAYMLYKILSISVW